MNLRNTNENVQIQPVSIEDLVSKLEKIQKVQTELVTLLSALNSVSSVIEADPDGKITFANELFCEISKYEISELIGKSFATLKSGKQQDELFEELFSQINRGEYWTGFISLKSKDGIDFWLDASVLPQVNTKGIIKKLIIVSFEITTPLESGLQNPLLKLLPEFKQNPDVNNQRIILLNQQLQKIIYEYNALSTALNNVVMVSETDKRGLITFVNDFFIQFTGYPRHELDGQNHRILKHTSSAGGLSPEVYDHLWNTISAGNVWRGHLQNVKRDGSPYWVDLSIVPIVGNDNKVEKYISFGFDVTDLYQNRLELKEKFSELEIRYTELEKINSERENYLKDLEQIQLLLFAQVSALNNTCCVCEIDLEGKIILVNDKFCQLTGYMKEELIGNNHLFFISEDTIPEIKTQLWTEVNNGYIWSCKLNITGKNGEKLTVNRVITPVRNENETIIKFVAIDYPITEFLEEIRELEQRISSLSETEIQLSELHQQLNRLEADEVKYIDYQRRHDNIFGEIHFDLNGKVFFANAAYLNLLNTTFNEVIGKDFDLFLHKEHSKKVDLEKLAGMLDGEFFTTFEILIDQNKHLIDVYSRFTTVRNKNDEVISYICYVDDITDYASGINAEKEHLEKELHSLASIVKQENEYLETYKSLGLSIELTKTGMIYSINNTVLEVTEFQSEDLLGMPLGILFSEKSSEEIDVLIQNGLISGESNKKNNKLELKTKSNGIIPIAMTIAPVLKNQELYRYMISAQLIPNEISDDLIAKHNNEISILQNLVTGLKEENHSLRKNEQSIQQSNTFLESELTKFKLYLNDQEERRTLELASEIDKLRTITDNEIKRINDTFDIERNNLVETIVTLKSSREEKQLLEEEILQLKLQYQYLYESGRNLQKSFNQSSRFQEELLNHNSGLIEKISGMEEKILSTHNQLHDLQALNQVLMVEKNLLEDQLHQVKQAPIPEKTSIEAEEKIKDLEKQLAEAQRLSEDYKFSENSLRLQLNDTLRISTINAKIIEEFQSSDANIKVNLSNESNVNIPDTILNNKTKDVILRNPKEQDQNKLQSINFIEENLENIPEPILQIPSELKVMAALSDWDLQADIAEMLSEIGIQNIIVGYGREALEKYEDLKPNIILLDVDLPDISGLDILDIIRKNYSDTQSKIFAVINFDQIENIQEYLAAGFTDVIADLKDTNKLKSILGY